MTIWEFLFPWPALRREMKATRSLAEKLRKARTVAIALDERVVGFQRAERESERRLTSTETELLQTKRAGFASIAEELGVSEEDLMDGKIEPLLHADPQKVYRMLDNAKASEIKFRLVKRVNLELRLVIRNMIDTLADCTLTPHAIADFQAAEKYAVPRVMEDKRKVLHLNLPKGDDDEAQAHLEAGKAGGETEGAASTEAEAGDREAEV